MNYKIDLDQIIKLIKEDIDSMPVKNIKVSEKLLAKPKISFIGETAIFKIPEWVAKKLKNAGLNSVHYDEQKGQYLIEPIVF